MRRIISLLLCLTTAFAFCACAGNNAQEAQSTPEAAEDAPKATQAAAEPEATEAPEPTAEPTAETAPEFLDVKCLSVDSYSYGDGQKYATYHVETMYLMDEDEAHHELDGTLGMSSFARTNELYDEYHDLLSGKAAAEVDPADPMKAYLWSGAYLRRADAGMVSILYLAECRGEGVERSSMGCFNAASDGRELELGDVIADWEAFLACVNAELGAYGDFSITEEDMNELVWVMDHDCMTVYFAVKSGRFDDIAAVCSCIALWYSAHPIMFNEEYLPEGTIHSAEFPMELPYRFEADGKMHELAAAHETGGDGTPTENIVITLDKKAYAFAAPTAALRGHNRFMHTEFGDFILVEAVEDGNDVTPVLPLLHVFAVRDGEVSYCGCFHGGMREWAGTNNTDTLEGVYRQLPTDPRAFRLIGSLDGLLSPALRPMNGIPAWRSYRMGADGMPEPVEQIYHVDGEYLFLLNTDLTADKLNEAGETDGSAEIYKQMALQYLATDGKTYVDMYVYEMDICVRLYLEDSGAKVNGFIPGELWTYVTDGVAVG